MQSYLIKLTCIFYLIITSAYGALSLNACYDLAIANSDTMSLADIRALIEEDRTREVWGMALPQLSASADFLTRGDVKDIHHHKHTKNARVSLIVPLFNFGGQKNLINAQEKREESAFINIESARLEVLHSTNMAYFLLLEAQKIVQVLQDSAQTLNNQQRITKDFVEQGLLHENETMIVEVELELLQQDLVQAQNNRSLAVAKLNHLIGYSLDYPTTVEDIFEETGPLINIDQLLCQALSNHPILKSLQAQIEASQYAHKAEKGKLYPNIYGYSNYSTTDDYALPYTHGLDAGIGLQMSIYDGGTTWAKLKRLKKETCELEQQYQAEEKNIELKMRTAFFNMENASTKIPITLKEIELAEKNLKMTEDHFSEGLVTNDDVVLNEEKLMKSRFNYFQALYQYHKAKADLIYAAGINLYKRGCKYDGQ